MALFTDGALNSIADLRLYENSILEVVSTEGLDPAAKIRLAQADVANHLLLFLLRQPLRDPRAGMRRAMGLTDIVVTPPLRHWHALKTLAFIYRDAYNNQLNDRYLGKCEQYESLSEQSLLDYLQLGVGWVANPVPRAGAPLVTTISVDSRDPNYYVTVTWVNPNGQEGASSDLMPASGTHLAVGIANMPSSIAAWNVYVGTEADRTMLQNQAPLSIGYNWVLPDTGLVPGRLPSEGQTPEQLIVHDRLLQRG